MNRFAICEGYYMFASLYHGGQDSKEYAYFGRLDKLGYKPGPGASSQDLNRLDKDSREVFDRLVANTPEGREKQRIEQLKLKVADRAERILIAVQSKAEQEAKRTKNYTIRNYLQEIELHYCGYAEPGCTDPECGLIATGNWNEITSWFDGKRTVVSNICKRLGDIFERMGIEIEWSDEWAVCSDCQKLVRTQPDSYQWKPFYTLDDSELICLECQPNEESEKTE